MMHRIERGFVVPLWAKDAVQSRTDEYETLAQDSEPITAREYKETVNVTRGLLLGILFSAPIWAALILFGAQVVRAVEHFDRWFWIVKGSSLTSADVMLAAIFVGILCLVTVAVIEGRNRA